MEASRTAIMVAAYRGRASSREDPVCADPWAAALGGDDGLALADLYDRSSPQTELFIALRTAAIDACVRDSIRDGATQVVLLGAGLDTRCARLARRDVRFFEVDHPGSQGEKRRRVELLKGYPVNAATYVACDFERDDWFALLTAAGFASDQPAFFVWEGVSYYLTEASVRRTLRRVAEDSHPRSWVVFDYVGKKLIEAPLRDAMDAATRERLAQMGEPLRFGTNDVLPLLYEEGFRSVRTATFDELALHFTASYERARKFRFQSLAIASRTSVGSCASF